MRDSGALARAAQPRYNIAPTQSNLVLRKSLDNPRSLEVAALRWGLIPSWSKSASGAAPMINARSESVAEKPAFQAAFQRRRCLVPADGYYEWKGQRGPSQPFFFHLADESVFFMAGIWEVWIAESGETIESYTILTTAANAAVSKYHDRMPVILPPERIETWLDSDISRLEPARRDSLLAPIDPELIHCRPANPLVNNNRNEGPQCLEAPEKAPVSQLDLGL